MGGCEGRSGPAKDEAAASHTHRPRRALKMSIEALGRCEVARSAPASGLTLWLRGPQASQGVLGRCTVVRGTERESGIASECLSDNQDFVNAALVGHGSRHRF